VFHKHRLVKDDLSTRIDADFYVHRLIPT
jgi:hypothetical protein